MQCFWCVAIADLLLCVLVVCRPDYMTTFVDKLINWEEVAKRYQAASS